VSAFIAPLAGCITAGATLASHCALRSDIDNDAARGNEVVNGVVHESKARDDIFLKRLAKIFCLVAKSDGVVAAGIVDDSVDASMHCHNFLDGLLNCGLVGHFDGIRLHAVSLGGLFGDDLACLFWIATEDAGNSSFFGEGSCYSSTDACCTACDEDDFIGEFQVHW
jgi:hypothetical protein